MELTDFTLDPALKHFGIQWRRRPVLMKKENTNHDKSVCFDVNRGLKPPTPENQLCRVNGTTIWRFWKWRCVNQAEQMCFHWNRKSRKEKSSSESCKHFQDRIQVKLLCGVWCQRSSPRQQETWQNITVLTVHKGCKQTPAPECLTGTPGGHFWRCDTPSELWFGTRWRCYSNNHNNKEKVWSCCRHINSASFRVVLPFLFLLIPPPRPSRFSHLPIHLRGHTRTRTHTPPNPSYPAQVPPHSHLHNNLHLFFCLDGIHSMVPPPRRQGSLLCISEREREGERLW